MHFKALCNAGRLLFRLPKQTLSAMKLTVLLIAASFCANAEGLAQKVTLSLKNAPLEQVFNQVKQQTGFSFIWDESILKGTHPVDIHVKDAAVSEVMDHCLKGQFLAYQIVGKIIVIKQQPEITPPAGNTVNAMPPPVDVRGRIVNEKGEPLAGVSVMIKGSQTGTTTDAAGNYLLNSVDKDAILLISAIGYESREVAVNGLAQINIQLTESVKGLNDIVVIGYGAQSKKNITGAIASINSKDINSVAVTGLDQALQGRMAGVQVTQNSGEPGGSISVKIRGVGSLNAGNEPLYVVDGMPLGVNINAINPNDIERIDVLKDAASAAIYGSRGSNGVVLITTKKGRNGKTVINADAYTGLQGPSKKIDLLNGPEFAKLANENLTNAGLSPNPAWNNPADQPSYDWQDAIFKSSLIQNYSISVSGGSATSRNFLSFGYFDQDGIIAGSGFERYTANWNTEYDISPRIKIGANISAAVSEKKNIPTDDDFFGTITNILQMQPTNPIYAAGDGPINDHLFGWQGYAFVTNAANTGYYPSGLNNPVHTAKEYLRNTLNSTQLNAVAFGEYEIIKGLKFRSAFNYASNNNVGRYRFSKSPVEIANVGPYKPASYYEENWNRSFQWVWVNTLSYTKSIGNHDFSLTAATDALRFSDRYIQGSGGNNPDDQPSINATGASGRQVQGAPSDASLISYVGRATYNYADKYLLTANIRRDGSSKFGPESKYGNFPSLSVAWRISHENFFDPVTFVDELKIRGSYGIVGNQNIGNFKYLNTYSNVGGYYGYTLGVGQNYTAGLFPDNIGDPAIHWEKSIQTDIGLDASFLKGMFTLTADYYIKKLEDLLGYFPVPSYTGVYGASIFKNGFSMQDKGLEIAAGYNETIGKVKFSAQVNFATLQNKITKLTDNPDGYVSQSISFSSSGPNNDDNAQTISRAGSPIAGFYGYVTDGIFQTDEEAAASGMGGVKAGDRRFRDLNGDKVVNSADKTILGNGIPKYTYGIDLRAEYKGFDLSVLLTGQGGAQIANMNKFFLYNMRYMNTTGLVNGSRDLLNSWHGEGTSNTMPRNDYNAPTSNRFFSSYYIENGAFLRIRNVQLGYNAPARLVSSLRASQLRIYVAAQNLFTFTKYSGFDPEVGSANIGGSQNPLTNGVDYGRYPLSRMFMVGISARF